MIAEAATSYSRAGLCVLPAILDEKRPAVGSWKAYQQCLPSEAQISQWFSSATACCLLTGAVSGNLEMIDFDAGGALFSAWAALVESQSSDLLARMVIERSRRGGKHVVYRCRSAVCGNMKLAQRRGDDGKLETLIETRGEGGLFLCAPSPGYELIQGDLAAPPVIEDVERDILLSAAWSLNECWKRQDSSPMVAAVAGRPGDDFNDRGDVRELLVKHGWTLARSGENEYWRRPGKSVGSSATLKDRVFYVFSSNATPFEPQRAYAPFTVFALLEHGGDYAAAASALRAQGYGGEPDTTSVDLSAFCAATGKAPPRANLPGDPGPIPVECLRIPGFVSQVMDFCMETAPYPNQVLAFCGALALQSFLAARKVRDGGDNRTNLYLLGLAHSASGKDWPRRINTNILWQVGLGQCVGDKFASGEGVQDALFQTPAMLFQTDEIDGMLLSITRSKDARYEGLVTTLLTMYTSSAGVYPMRRMAGKGHPGEIHQPSLTIFGTAIPNHYYQALSERLLTNGFFARTIVLEAGSRADGQEPAIRDIPERIIETARWWANCRSPGNLGWERPTAAVVPHSESAKAALVEIRRQAEHEYRKSESTSDEVGTTVWGRVSENVRKLALVYAVSENHQNPEISEQAVHWAGRFVEHQTRRMLFMAASHVADNPFHAECLKLTRMLQDAPDRQKGRRELLRAMRCKAADFDQIVGTLLQQGDIVPVEINTRTKPAQGYRLA